MEFSLDGVFPFCGQGQVDCRAGTGNAYISVAVFSVERRSVNGQIEQAGGMSLAGRERTNLIGVTPMDLPS